MKKFKRYITCLISMALPLLANAQSAASGVSTALNDWGKYLMWGAVLVGAFVGLALNMEKRITRTKLW